MSVIVGGARTGIGRLLGSLKDVSAVELGATAIRGALEKSGVSAKDVDYVIMGHVNKVCLSGINAIAMADQLIRSGEADVVIAGGMESMTNAPHVLVGSREGMKYGDWTLKDTMAFDGLYCAIDQLGMGEATDKYTAAEKISRERQDEFSAKS
ncbi:MAG: acetyl-CoA C-acyltransferase, partial [Actinobacteria bacterium]|nr:acetyl-CoA C-acyltransferase [Actinomycetota bacterium]